MKIIGHRGIWESVGERNTEEAFHRCFRAGFGTETDIRDLAGALVISHDPPRGGEQTIGDLLVSADRVGGAPLTLALNIKSDGLAESVAKALAAYSALDCFVFDMSVPDMRSYFKTGVPVFTRMSEVEPTPAYLTESKGVWLDSFEGDWFDGDLIESILDKGKRVCVVSPELHGRKPLERWNSLRRFAEDSQVILCTDWPGKASAFFANRSAP